MFPRLAGRAVLIAGLSLTFTADSVAQAVSRSVHPGEVSARLPEAATQKPPPDSVLFRKALLAIRERFRPEAHLGVDPRPSDPKTWYDYENLPDVNRSIVAVRERVARRLDFAIVEIPTSPKCGGDAPPCLMISLPRPRNGLPGWADASCNAGQSKTGKWWSVRTLLFPKAYDHGSTYEYFFTSSPSTRSYDLVCSAYVPLGA